MSVYTIEEVVQRWKLEELTAEQAIGQLLLHVQLLNDRAGLVERRVDKLYREKRSKKNGSPSESEGTGAGRKRERGAGS